MVEKCLFDMSDLDINRRYYSINIYMFRFLEYLPEKHIERFVLLVNEDNFDFLRKRFPKFNFLIHYRKTLFQSVPLIGGFISLIRHTRLINKSGCSVFFSASNYDFNNILNLKIRKVVVIHDLKSIWERKGSWDYLLHNLKTRFYYKRLINSSDIVIPISNYTKSDINITFPSVAKANKLNVVYNGVPFLTTSSPLPINEDRPFILYVNTLIKTKNFETLLNAYNICEHRNLVDLVVVGKKTNYWNTDIEPLIKKFNLERSIKLFSNLKDEELAFLYSKALLFVSPSLNEGFGYTPIEAAMNKCPVLCTKCEALPDTTRGKVYYYDNPMDEKELATKIDKILDFPPSDENLNEIASFFKDIYNPNKQVKEILSILFSSHR